MVFGESIFIWLCCSMMCVDAWLCNNTIEVYSFPHLYRTSCRFRYSKRRLWFEFREFGAQCKRIEMENRRGAKSSDNV